jgi:hypothetical protein
MAVCKQKAGKFRWYKVKWNGSVVRQSTKQTNKRVAEQMEAAYKTALAKVQVRCAAKPRTVAFYRENLARLLEFESRPPRSTASGRRCGALSGWPTSAECLIACREFACCLARRIGSLS